MGNRNKAKGTAFETQVLRYLLSRGFSKAQRTPLKGTGDTGDINGITRTEYGHSNEVVIQCKNAKTFKLSEWLNDAQAQAINLYDERWTNAHPEDDCLVSVPSVVVFKRPGVGEKTLGQTYALLTLDDLAFLLQQAGYE